MANMKATLGVSRPYTVVRNAAEPAVFDAATKDWFEREYGVKDFVLTVGLVEVRKNQLMLLHALKDQPFPVVVIGRNYNRHYMRLCREFAGKKHETLFIEHLPHDLLASALKAARVFALPSWMECASFAIVEAALAGCPLVVSDRTSEPEYFGDDAYYCDPADVDSIRDAVLRAYEGRDADAPKRARLQDLFRNRYTWKNAGLSTLEGYRKAFEGRGLAFPGDPAPPHRTGGREPVLA
jgi:glycosyltransferase involved in cell wall biosynthesis